MLHVDISNTGETIEKLYEGTKDQVENGAVVLFEGGTYERDTVEWMLKYKKSKITDVDVPYRIINGEFPGLSQII
jgi:hypothetical protein